MPAYTPKVASIDPAQVGTLYNIAIGDGTRIYGYVFQNNGGQQSTGIKEDTNTQDRDKMIQISSPNVIDRDLTTGLPRVTQGDFSGGGLQTVFLDPTRYFDSDLEIRTPGYLTLRPAWKRVLIGSGSTGVPQCVVWNNDVYTCWGPTFYVNSAGTQFNTPGAVNCHFVDTDGASLFVGDGVNTVLATVDNISYTTVSSAMGSFSNMWVINLGTAGRHLYFTRTASLLATLNYIDLSTSTIVPLPTGSLTESIIDIAPYQTGIAILASNSQGGGNATIWFHDGANMTKIADIGQYNPVGLCNCLGNLYVTATSNGNFEGPVLIQVQGGSVTVVARFASPIALLTSAGIGAPEATGQYVYFALTAPQINYVTTVSYLSVFDAVAGSISHMGALDANDAPQTAQPRQLAAVGRAAAFPMNLSGSTYLQYQTNTNRLAAGNTYSHSGEIVTSRLDFGTPALTKRLRQVGVIHAPLEVGESVQISAFPDGDQFHVGQTPSVVGAPNSTPGSTTTLLGFTSDTICKTVYSTVTLGAGTTSGTDSTTPNIIRMWWEIQDTWTWTFDLDASYRRRTIAQFPDGQGVNGKDLYWLLRNAWEQGTVLTLYLAEGLSYSVQVDSMSAKSVAYVNHQGAEGGPVLADQEWLINQLILKQVA